MSISVVVTMSMLPQWHSLTREEQAKYYEKARQERQLHLQLYPGWSARDNYGYGAKKKKRKKERSTSSDTSGGIPLLFPELVFPVVLEQQQLGGRWEQRKCAKIALSRIWYVEMRGRGVWRKMRNNRHLWFLTGELWCESLRLNCVGMQNICLASFYFSDLRVLKPN